MAFAGCTGSVPIPQKVLVGSFYSFPQKSHTKYKECFVACQRMIRKSIGRFMTTEVILMEKNNKKTKDQLKGEKWKKVLWKLGLQLKFKNFQSFQITCSVLCQAPRYLDANWLCLLKPDYFTVNLIQKELIGVIPIFERITHPPKVITQSNQISLPPQALPADVAVAAVPCTVGTNAGWRSKRSLERLGILKRNKETQYALYSWVTHKFTLISVSSSPGPAKNNSTKKKFSFIVFLIKWYEQSHQHYKKAESYSGEVLKITSCQTSPAFRLASENKVSLTYLLWALILQRGQQLQRYSHFFLIRCLGMLMWK